MGRVKGGMTELHFGEVQLLRATKGVLASLIRMFTGLDD